jgi:DNA-binding CsgD family transcriptional regulator
MQSHARQRRIIKDRFLEASIEPSSWLSGLEALARATGSLRAQLLGVDANGELAFNFVTQADDDFRADFARLDGHHDLEVNYRMASSLTASPGRVVSEGDYALTRGHLGPTEYEELCEKHGLPFGCQLTLDDPGGALVGLALLRSRAEGPTRLEHRRLFLAVASDVRAAVRLQKRIGERGSELMRGALDQVAVAAMLIDGFGRVAAVTPDADRVLSASDGLKLAHGRLSASTIQATSELQATLDRVLHAGCAEAATLLRSTTGLLLRLKIHALPRMEWDLGFTPHAIVILNPTGSEVGELRRRLQHEFGLTGAESIVAASLADNASPEEIAEERATSIVTVRHQIKSIFAKVYVGRHAEFMEVVASLRRDDLP